MEFEKLSNRVIGCAMDVHKLLGPGLLESAYETCLVYELEQAHLCFERQYPVPVEYKGIRFNCGFRIDILVENQIILELKSVDALNPVHNAQLLTYMKLAKIRTGLLINFNESRLKEGLKRFVL